MSGTRLRLLALDGVCGLSVLMILERLMETVNQDKPPKPCDCFDMIGGTGTSGLIAVMLGRLRMSVAECIIAYLSLYNNVFCKTQRLSLSNHLSLKIWYRMMVKGQVQGRFDERKLAQAVKEVVSQQGLQEDALLKDTDELGCKVFVCATSKETGETVCLTSYHTAHGSSDQFNSMTIWEACRATSFFDPIAVGRFSEDFVDGATGANNPVREMWDQAQLVWGPEPLKGEVKCLVSIGTGVPSLKMLAAEQTAEYYRFNVVEKIGLEEAKTVKAVAAATRRYISSEEMQRPMQACAGAISR